MMLRKSTVATLSVLVVVATALPYSEWNHARYRWNDLFAARSQEVPALVRSQATVVTSACATITETVGGRSYTVRVCTADREGILMHANCLHVLKSALRKLRRVSVVRVTVLRG